jgi:hypothetical protein
MGIFRRFEMRRFEHVASRALMAAAVAMCGLLFVKAASVAVQAATAKTRVAEAFEASRKDADALDRYKKAMQEKVKKAIAGDPFLPEALKPQPPQPAGIMGDEALFNGQWYKVGSEVAGAKILRIDPLFVKLEFQGKETVVVPQAAPDPNARMQTGGMPRGGPGGDSGRDRGDRGAFGPGRGGFGGGFGRFNMSPEERESMRQRFMNMSPEERRNAFRQMRESMGGPGQ